MDWLTLILMVLVGFFGIFYVFSKRVKKFEKLGILHVTPLPFFGNTAGAFFRRSHFSEVIDKLYKLNEDAEYVGFYDLSEPIIVIRSPELIKCISVKYFDHFMDHRNIFDPKDDTLFAKNLMGLRGERWKEMRNLLSPAFTSSKMKTMFKLMLNCGINFVDYLIEDMGDRVKILDTKEAFTRYTTDVIATCAFGISVDSMRNPKNDFYTLGRDMMNFNGFRVLRFFLIRCFPKIAKFFNVKFISDKAEKFFTNIVKDTIETREREGINRPDMIQLMMEMRGKKSGQGPALSIQDMTAQALIFFLGGFESSSTAMCFAAHEIAVNFEVQEKLRDEIDKVLEETSGQLNYEAINGMQYLDAVINETLRMYPVTLIMDRLCVKTFELPPPLPGSKSIMIEPGQNLWFPAYSIQRDRKYFANPDKFDPERFMGGGKNNIDSSTYFPFGQGPRMCIGNRFALLEIKVLLFNLLAKCHLEPSEKMHLPLELDKKNVLMAPRGGFLLQLKSRNTEKLNRADGIFES